MRRRPLPKSFYRHDPVLVARALLGCVLQRRIGADLLTARIVETEAYLGANDPASHARRGLRSERNESMYLQGGHAYVYFTYGMHWCLNTATGVEGVGEGCLLRAAEPLAGLACMRERRAGVRDRDLLRGPARLAQAYGLDGSWSGRDLCAAGPVLHLADDGSRPPVAVGPRTGVATAPDVPWRFFVPDSPWVSPYKRHPRAQAS